MRMKRYISNHKVTIKKAAIVGVPTAAGIVIGGRAGLIPYKQIAGVTVEAGRKIPLSKIPVKQIGMKAKDGVEMLAGNETVAKVGQELQQELKQELEDEAKRLIRKKIRESHIDIEKLLALRN